MQLTIQSNKSRSYNANNAGDLRATKTPVHIWKPNGRQFSGERSRTWGSHHGVLRASEPAETAGGQGPLAIKEALEAVWWLLVPRGLNIYRGEAARRLESSQKLGKKKKKKLHRRKTAENRMEKRERCF